MPNADSFTGAGPPPMPRPPEGPDSIVAADAFSRASAAVGVPPEPRCWNPSYDHIREWCLLAKRHLFLSFPYVCPEPVLAK
jgi:hypothetical protein